MSNLINSASLEVREIIMKSLGELVSTGELSAEPIPAFNVEIPADKSHGDLSTNVAMICARAFKMAPRKIADLIISKIILDGTYFEKSYVQNQMLGKALLESMMILNKKAVVSVIRLKEMEFFQAKPSDLDGIVSVLRQTRGVEVAILLYELEPQTFKVSLRSKEIVDVSAVAKYYGGGGHVRAAGVTMKGSPHDVINNLTLLIERQLRAAEEKNEEK